MNSQTVYDLILRLDQDAELTYAGRGRTLVDEEQLRRLTRRFETERASTDTGPGGNPTESAARPGTNRKGGAS